MACTAVARPKAKAATAINLIIVFSRSIKEIFLEGNDPVMFQLSNQMLVVNTASRRRSIFSLAAKTVERRLAAPRERLGCGWPRRSAWSRDIGRAHRRATMRRPYEFGVKVSVATPVKHSAAANRFSGCLAPIRRQQKWATQATNGDVSSTLSRQSPSPGSPRSWLATL
jgi:hypothetical protein